MISVVPVENQQILYFLMKTEEMDMSGVQPCRNRGFQIEDYDAQMSYATGIDYLNRRLQNPKVSGIEYSYNKLVGESEGGSYLLKNLRVALDFDNFYTSGYDPKGFVGWHSDTDIFGYYIVFAYQGETDAIFRYRDIDTQEIKDFINTPGWNVFSFTLGKGKDDAVWHCATSESKRFTFLLHFNTKDKLEKALSVLTKP